MNNNKVLVVFTILFSLILFACGGNDEKKEEKETKEVNEMRYICPMKCEKEKTYSKDIPCPVCGMKMEKV